MATQVVGDGAPWIWNLAAEHFCHSRQVVDWYHATEHLGVAAKLGPADCDIVKPLDKLGNPAELLPQSAPESRGRDGGGPDARFV